MDAFDTGVIESSARPPSPDRRRFHVLTVSIAVIGVMLLGRGFYLQVVHGSQFRERAENNRVNLEIVPAPRGIVYDRNQTPLVKNISSTDLILDPALLPNEEHESYLMENLSTLITELEPEDVRDALVTARATKQPTLLVKALTHDQVLKLEESDQSITGARLVSSLVRDYLYTYSTAHVLGYTGPVSEDELSEHDDLYPTDSTGKQGIEAVYDDILRGKHGISYTEVNARGRPQTDLGTVEPQPGEDLQLTLDIELQKFVYSLFSEQDQKRQEQGDEPLSGAVVVLHPQTGGILALVSYPSFNANAFSQPSQNANIAPFFSNEQKPLFNRAVDGTYPSGSTIKPFIAAGALEEGVITPETTVRSTGGISIGPWQFKDWKAGGHGITDVRKAIAESVNTFFYTITGGYEDMSGLGVQRTNTYLSGFGWGSKTGIDLSSEASGFLPTPEWKETEKGEPWYIGDTYHLGIGQGDVLATPLQIASSTGGVANGERIHQPHFVDGDVPTSPLPVSPRNVQVVREGMRQTVTEGSARSLSQLDVPIAGKTGTAQIGGTDKTHAWFTSFGPYNNPEVVVTVLLEKAGSGDEDAVPFAREIWQWLGEQYFSQTQYEVQ